MILPNMVSATGAVLANYLAQGAHCRASRPGAQARLQRAHVLRLKVGDGVAAELTEYPIELGGEYAERALHAGLAAGRKAVECRAADHNRLRSEGERFGEIGAAPHAAIQKYGETSAGCGDNLGQHID